MNAKNIVIAILALVLIGSVSYLMLNGAGDTTVIMEDTSQGDTVVSDQMPIQPGDSDSESVDEMMVEERGPESIIGTSINGNDITAYHFGTGEKELLFVGGVHGGYSWSTALLAYELVDYLKANPDIIPSNVSVTVIPVLNPDGLELAVGKTGRFETTDALAITEATRVASRFNANDVDLNRNFDCDWKEAGTWQNKEVSGGSSPFSEAEASALQKYVETYEPVGAVVWFGSEGKVYPSACGGNPSKASIELAATFATAAGYGAAAEFNAYDITGDMVNWMAKQGIPAISVLLADYKDTEWSKNRAGVEAILKTYAE